MSQIHTPILKAFDELRFNLGKKTFIDFIKGNENATIDRNNLDEYNSYGTLFKHDEDELEYIIKQLIDENYLQIQEIRGGFKVLARTLKGGREIFEKKFSPKEKQSKAIKNIFFADTKITKQDKQLFKAFDFFLKEFNDEQKKAIICQDKHILCVAGAGSGKTTVLTKRIEFLKKFKSVEEKKILAITFTKKARDEMKNRLEKLGILNTKIETFNSFCEKILKIHGKEIYNKPTRVASYKDKIQLVNQAIKECGTGFEMFFDDYFNKRQLKEKTKDELFFIFVNDVFSIVDFYKNLEEKVEKFYERETHSIKNRISKLMYDIVLIVQKELKNRGLRDFSDQITDTLNLFRKNPQLIPKYDYILIDEYQDLNLVQFELIKEMKPNNLFAVGDPRQAIYGWRGSDIKFILDFPKIFKNTQIISLKKNYRSNKAIVELFNNSIKSLGLIDLESGKREEENNEENKTKSIYIQEFKSEQLERIFVLEAIKNSKNPRNEIFVLARTNRILKNFEDLFVKNGINYIIKAEEEYKNQNEAKDNQVTLATVHSIKGMEAKEVYVVSTNTNSFPNKAQDNFILSLIKEDNDYDKESEELRLFYVALSRAKEKLIITYTGNHSKFITENMLSLLDVKKKNKSLFEYSSNHKPSNLDSKDSNVLKNMLKDWRSEKSQSTGLPLYMIITNNAIEELAKFKPQSKTELFNINGLGTMKIAKFGDEILKIICG